MIPSSHSLLSVKSEDDEKEAKVRRAERQSLRSDCEGSEPARNSDPNSHL